MDRDRDEVVTEERELEAKRVLEGEKLALLADKIDLQEKLQAIYIGFSEDRLKPDKENGDKSRDFVFKIRDLLNTGRNEGNIKKEYKELKGSEKEKRLQVHDFRLALRDAKGELLVINGVVLTGSAMEDQGSEGGSTAEKNFHKGKKNTKLWHQMLFGADTIDPKEAKNYALGWRTLVSLSETDADHRRSVRKFNESMYLKAAELVQQGTAHPLEAKFAPGRWVGWWAKESSRYRW
ncbi:hypothetical protein V492_06036 [Pseudogymnoascus sp. VKM F-4246]|nr:hypothetical protein V492_06036 [Pseudogymnoascus sp. VKM F-4246]